MLYFNTNEFDKNASYIDDNPPAVHVLPKLQLEDAYKLFNVKSSFAFHDVYYNEISYGGAPTFMYWVDTYGYKTCDVWVESIRVNSFNQLVHYKRYWTLLSAT